MNRFLFALVGAVLVIIVAEGRAADPSVLSQEQIKNQVVGNTVKTGDWVEYIRPDGTTLVIFKGTTYDGAWQFKGEEGVMCFKYKRSLSADGCFRVSLSKDGKSVMWRGATSGNVLHRTILLSGDRTK